MKLFDFGRVILRRNEAATCIQKCFETFERNGLGTLPRNYRQLAVDLVTAAWPELPAAEGGIPPHRLSVAAYALARGLGVHRQDERLSTLLAAALGVVLKSASTELGEALKNPADKALVQQSRTAFLTYGQALPEPGTRVDHRRRWSKE